MMRRLLGKSQEQEAEEVIRAGSEVRSEGLMIDINSRIQEISIGLLN